MIIAFKKVFERFVSSFFSDHSFFQDCPFKLHFLKMLSLLDAPEVSPELTRLIRAGDVRAQIQHCFRAIAGDRDYKDLGVLFKVVLERQTKSDWRKTAKFMKISQ